MTTIHTRQLQQNTRSTNNNTHKTTTTIHTVNQQQLHTRQLKTSNKTHKLNAIELYYQYIQEQMLPLNHSYRNSYALCNLFLLSFSTHFPLWFCYSLDFFKVYSAVSVIGLMAVMSSTLIIIKWILLLASAVKALCYKSEGCRFDSRWCHWNFSLT